MMIRPTGEEGEHPEYRNEQSQRNLQFMQNRPDVLSTVSSTGTGIKIRSRQPNNQSAQNNVSHGIAPRRIRMQLELQGGQQLLEPQGGCDIDKNWTLPHGHFIMPMIMEVSKLLYFQSILFVNLPIPGCNFEVRMICMYRTIMIQSSKPLLLILLQMLFLQCTRI